MGTEHTNIRYFNFLNLAPLRLCVFALILTFGINAQTLAPGGPGKDAHWSTAGKQAIGTSASLDSKVWFTLAQGVMTEVYYPNVTVANVETLQFVVVNPKTKKVETERDDANHEVKVTRPDSLTFQQINTARSGEWKITKTYTTAKFSSVLIDVQFETQNHDLNLYVYFDPSIENTGMHDTGYSEKNSFVSFEGDKSIALTFSSKIAEMTNGFYQSSDGIDELRNFGQIVHQYKKAQNGNVVQMARILQPTRFTTVLTLEDTKKSLGIIKVHSSITAVVDSEIVQKKGFAKCLAEYESGWADYVKTLPKVDPKYQAQFNMAAMVLKAQEDKRVRGANVASLTVPWGGGANANEDVGGGYHLVWARDLYHVFTAYLALGDKPAAERALDFLFNIQQKEDGSFPQNSWLDGKKGWGSLQMDEVGYPLIMAWQLGRFDKPTYENHIKRAADFLVKNGPSTPQERWEERPGYSPSTIAAEIAGLVCAADIAKKNGDDASALIYLAAADDWARNVERWTATTTGKYGDGNYYIRISEKGEPDGGHKIELNNNAGSFNENEIVDAGFLELVRLGIKSADDPLIAKSIKIIDQLIKVDTPNGPAFYRYNHDGYGEMDDGRRWNWDGKYTGKGRLWALLSGERGQYEIAECGMRNADSKAETRPVGSMSPAANAECLAVARTRLDSMLAFANEGLMIPEQVWDSPKIPNADKQYVPELKFGEGTGSATPLAWSMGQFIRLATNLKAGKNLDTPQVVYDRYKNGIPGQVSDAGGTDIEFVLPPLKAGEVIRFPRNAQPKTKFAYQLNGVTSITESDAQGMVTLEFKMPEADTVGTLGIQAADGTTAFERVTLRLKPKTEEFSTELIEKAKAAKTSPFADNGKAVFFYRGAAKQVGVAGDMTSWNPGKIVMQKIGDELFAYYLDIGPAARFEYKLIVDDKWMVDPLNPNSNDNGVGDRNSSFEMPGYKPNGFAAGEDSKLDEFDLDSKKFGTRKIKVYVPTGVNAILNERSVSGGDPLPVLYIEDGSDYINRAKAVQTQQNLVKAGKVRPFIMVFIDPKERNKEYWANDKWADFIADEIVPEIDKRYSTIHDRDGRATLGASLGGITSLWIGLKHPDKFGRLGGQSSSFWVDNGRVVKELEKLDASDTKFRFYLDDGMIEGVDDTRRVNVMLRGKGYPVTYVEGNTAHNWTAWRDRLADAFIALFK